jgi:hypothetical protein
MRKLNPGGKCILYSGRANSHQRHRSIRSQLYGGAGYRVDVIVADHIIGVSAVTGERLGRNTVYRGGGCHGDLF